MWSPNENWDILDILVLLLSCPTKQEQVNIINPAQLGHMQTDLPSSEMESSTRIQTCLATVKDQVGRERGAPPLSSSADILFCYLCIAIDFSQISFSQQFPTLGNKLL